MCLPAASRCGSTSSPTNPPSTTLQSGSWQLHEAPYQCNSQRLLWYDKSDPPARVEQLFYAYEQKTDKGGLKLTK